MAVMKRVTAILISLAMTMLLCTPAYAAEFVDDEYVQILNEINEEYHTDIGYGYVDKEKVSLDEYREFMETVAQYSAETDEAIRKRHNNMEVLNAGIALASTQRTATADVWGSWASSFAVTATYTVNGNKIVSLQSAKVKNKNILGFLYTANAGSPTSSIIDSGRTLTVTFYGTVRSIEGAISATNVKLYTEFTAST